MWLSGSKTSLFGKSCQVCEGRTCFVGNSAVFPCPSIGCIKDEQLPAFFLIRPMTLTSGSLDISDLDISWCPRFQGLLRTAQPDFGLHRCCVQILLQTIWTSGCTTRACHGCSWDEPHRRSGSLAAILLCFLLPCYPVVLIS